MSEIFVANLNYDTSDQELRALFAEYGDVKNARHIIDKETQRPRGFGFVTMGNAEDAARAIDALNGQEYKGRAMVARPAEPRGQRPHGGPKEAQHRQRYEGKGPRSRHNW